MKKYTINDLSSMQDILKTAIKREEEARDFYLQARERARTPAETEMFEQLAEQELNHKVTLQKQLDEIQAQIETDRALSFDMY